MSLIDTQTETERRRAGARPGLWAELVDWREAETLAGPWRELAGDAIEENPFYAPWTLLPALQAYADDRVRLACVWNGPSRRALVGFAPVEARRGYARLAIEHWATWTHPHCFFAAPLIRRDSARPAAEAFLRLLCDGAAGRAFARLQTIDPEGPAARAFRAAAVVGERHCYLAGGYARAALVAGCSPEDWLAQTLRKKKRKELARLRKRLAEHGGISIRILNDAADLESWTEAFLSLEDKSWKGECGTSLKASPADAAWFRKSLAGAFDAGLLQFFRLDCADRPIAMLVGFGGARAYQLKIAYDPDFARYSPGVMIEIEATRRLLADPAFAFMDSCAAPGHPMIEGLWKDRRRIAGVNISGAGAASKTALRLCQTLERARGALGSARSASGGGAAS